MKIVVRMICLVILTTIFYSLSPPPLLIPMYGFGMNGRNDGYWLYNFRDSGMDLCPYRRLVVGG